LKILDKSADHTLYEATDVNVLSKQLRSKVTFSGYEKLIGSILLLNLGFLLVRPQAILPVLSDAKITVALFLISFAFWLKRSQKTWHRETLIILGLLLFHAGMIFFSRYIWNNFVINTGVAASAWFDIIQYLFCFLFPLLVYLTCCDQFKRLTSLLIFAGAFIGIYAITHSGRGPAGFLGDENDCGLMLVFLLPYPLFALPLGKNILRKLLILTTAAIIVAGIIATNSRGTFVGLVCTLGFVFLHSRNKGLLITLALVGFLAAVPFIPHEYIDRMKTIKQTDQGTAQTRFEYWGTALRAWSDPRNTIQGVGLNNIPWRLHQYQGAEFGLTREGMGGRQVHSMHIQIIADLGLIGVALLGYLVFRSIAGNNRSRREIHLAEKALRSLTIRYKAIQSSNELIINQNSPVGENDFFLRQIISFQKEATFMLAFFNCLNASWIALLVSGSFISVLYYPTLWMIIIISLAAQIYWKETRQILGQSLELSQELLPNN